MPQAYQTSLDHGNKPADQQEIGKLVTYLHKGRHQKKNCIKSENGTIGGEGVRKIIEFSSFTNDEKHGRGGVSE